ncbi:phospho-acceptor domain-containing protein [Neolewinella xylanilytica]|uniref:histidine kinase n=1 Tax=Neolewinella xylanilytica TaxID=1514080 RepID=A0A2S6I578_9BACT|nr:HAMP domain-containing sensor histidine kinase [Neolewinella xylanilytica]PPK86326.1 phospho-acceptor domain-containing protein [Neolewinella xylanilytica]
MTRLGISFLLASLLVTGLLFAYLRESYVDARELLIERIDADLNQLSTNNLLQHIKLIRSRQPDSLRLDTLIQFKSLSMSGNASPDQDDVDVSIRIFDTTDQVTGSIDPARHPFAGITRHLTLHSQKLSPSLDSLGKVYQVQLREFTSATEAGEHDVLVVRQQVGLLSSGREGDGPVIGMTAYRLAVVSSLGFELLSSCLLLIALGFAAFTAFRSLREHRRQLADREALLANLSHELKTPIAAVSVALEAMDCFGADAQPERRREYIQLSRQELSRLDRLADYAIGALKLKSGEAHVDREPVDLPEIAVKVWSGLSLQYGVDPTALTITTTGDSVPVRLYAQEFRLALSNLLENAIKYGGSPPVVRLLLVYTPGVFTCSVADEGPGIPATESERIFERFYRIADERTGHAVKGHGLGLSLVRQVADLHGGTVGVRRNDTGGATFSLQLPLP